MKNTIDIRASIHNRFDIEVIDACTGQIRQRAQAMNVICNSLWSRLLARKYYADYILFGSGTGIPSETDTALFSLLGAKTVTDGTYSVDNVNGVVTRVMNIVITETEYVGSTFTEVGVGYSTTAIATHAMLVDMNGNPISITKTDADIINIYATLYLHFNSNGYSDGNIRFVPSTNRYSFVRRLLGENLIYIDIVYAIMQRHAFMNFEGDAPSFLDITTSSNVSERTMTFALGRIAAANGNASGIEYISIVSGNGTTHIGDILIFPDAFGNVGDIAGEVIGTGDGTTTAFHTKFGYPKNATVYVNGDVVTGGVTVRSDPFLGSDESIANSFVPVVYSSENDTFHVIVKGYNISYKVSNVFYIKDAFTSANPFKEGIYWNRLGVYISRVGLSSCGLYASNDGKEWTLIGRHSQTSGSKFFDVGAVWNYYKVTDAVVTTPMIMFEGDKTHNVFFDTPPAVGDIISIDYHTPTIPKDSDHVFDMSITLSFGEYIPD